MKIGVFLTSAMEIDETYREQTKALAQQLAERGHGVVFGGTDYGLMKVLADAYKESGGKQLIGVFAADLIAVTKNYQKSPKLDKEFTEETMHERKQRMMDLSDGFIVFPGGYGTLEEISVIIGGKANKLYDKPIVAFNTNDFYRGLILQLEHAYKEKFSKLQPSDLVLFSDQIDAIFVYLEKYTKKEFADKFVQSTSR